MINSFTKAKSFGLIVLLCGCILPGIGAASQRCAIHADLPWDYFFKGAATFTSEPSGEEITLQADIYAVQFMMPRPLYVDALKPLAEPNYEKSRVQFALYNDDRSICHEFAIGFIGAGVPWELSYRGDLDGDPLWHGTWFHFPKPSLDLSPASISLHGEYGPLISKAGTFDLEARRLMDQQGSIEWFESELQLSSGARLKLSGAWVAGKPGWPGFPLSIDLERGADDVSRPFRLKPYLAINIHPTSIE
ncbi:MAG: hypothetical protein O9254_01485 [Rhodobacteraceae bacterium]|nr:hypothetical protein [Paracoccaceae bacterium]